MLVYEKKNDEGVRHLYGNYTGTVPTDNDPQLTYKDAQGVVEVIVPNDTYLDDKSGGIIRKSDGKAVNVFIGENQIIPKPVANDSNNVEEEIIEEPIEEIEEEPEEEEEE